MWGSISIFSKTSTVLSKFRSSGSWRYGGTKAVWDTGAVAVLSPKPEERTCKTGMGSVLICFCPSVCLLAPSSPSCCQGNGPKEASPLAMWNDVGVKSLNNYIWQPNCLQSMVQVVEPKHRAMTGQQLSQKIIVVIAASMPHGNLCNGCRVVRAVTL